MNRRTLDNEYRHHEPDPDLTRKAAVALLTHLTQDPHALARFAQDCLALKGYGLGDDAHDALYEACGRAVIAIPEDQP